MPLKGIVKHRIFNHVTTFELRRWIEKEPLNLCFTSFLFPSGQS